MNKLKASEIVGGSLGNLVGIPIYEDKNIREGTFICLDKNGTPIPLKDIKTKVLSKIIVHDIEKFKISMKLNNDKNKKR